MTHAEALAKIREETEQIRKLHGRLKFPEGRLALAEALAETAEICTCPTPDFHDPQYVNCVRSRAERALRRAAGEEGRDAQG